MEPGVTMILHLNQFDQLLVAMQAVTEIIDEQRQLVMLLSSL